MPHRYFALFVLAALCTPVTASGQGHVAPGSNAPLQDSLARQAKISPDSARKVALRHVRGGTVESVALEHEHGTLVYSYDIMVPGKTGVDEVQVDARTGRVVSFKHESPAPEKRKQHKADSGG